MALFGLIGRQKNVFEQTIDYASEVVKSTVKETCKDVAAVRDTAMELIRTNNIGNQTHKNLVCAALRLGVRGLGGYYGFKAAVALGKGLVAASAVKVALAAFTLLLMHDLVVIGNGALKGFLNSNAELSATTMKAIARDTIVIRRVLDLAGRILWNIAIREAAQ